MLLEGDDHSQLTTIGMWKMRSERVFGEILTGMNWLLATPVDDSTPLRSIVWWIPVFSHTQQVETCWSLGLNPWSFIFPDVHNLCRCWLKLETLLNSWNPKLDPSLSSGSYPNRSINHQQLSLSPGSISINHHSPIHYCSYPNTSPFFMTNPTFSPWLGCKVVLYFH